MWCLIAGSITVYLVVAGGISRVVSILQSCPLPGTGHVATASTASVPSKRGGFRPLSMSTDSPYDGMDSPDSSEPLEAVGVASCIRLVSGLLHCGIGFWEEVRVSASPHQRVVCRRRRGLLRCGIFFGYFCCCWYFRYFCIFPVRVGLAVSCVRRWLVLFWVVENVCRMCRSVFHDPVVGRCFKSAGTPC